MILVPVIDEVLSARAKNFFHRALLVVAVNLVSLVLVEELPSVVDGKEVWQLKEVVDGPDLTGGVG